MPSGVLSLGTIATRLRDAARDAAIDQRDADNLVACADTLEHGTPSSKQLRAIAKVVSDLALDRINDPAFMRCVGSLDYWVTWSTGDVPVTPKGKPEWMVHNEEAERDPRRRSRVSAFTRAIRVLLDEIDDDSYTNDTLDDIVVLLDAMRHA
jgi:hypothetical protein